jgi:hypothetical protein
MGKRDSFRQHNSLRSANGKSAVHFLMIEAHPKPKHPDYGTVDGAFVTFYINEALVDDPEDAARSLIEGQGWDVAEICESYPLALEDLGDDHPARERFEQAQVDGIVANFNTWPLRPPQ